MVTTNKDEDILIIFANGYNPNNNFIYQITTLSTKQYSYRHTNI